MAGGYQNLPDDALEQLRRLLEEHARRLSELERPSGSQIYDSLATITALVQGLIDQTEVNVTGNITAGGTGTFNNKLFVPNAYSNNLTGSGGFRTAYWSLIGEAGYVPSSIQFKRDVVDAAIDPQDVLDIRLVRYRYKDAVENMGDDAPTDVGVIAEEVDSLGLSFLVDYDENGEPFGVKYERLSVALLAVVQSLARRVEALEG